MKKYDFHLQTGPRNKHLCPSCGRRSYVLYVDANDNYLDETVGKCDHIHSCGHHYPPSEYFKDNPDARIKRNDWIVSPPEWLDKKPDDKLLLEERPFTIPIDIVRKTQRYDLGPKVNLWRFMDTILDPLVTEGVFYEYGVGISRSGAVVYWQFDTKGRCRGGKIITYGADGHRVKNDDSKHVTWAHSLLRNRLPKEWKLCQCLFGEHLLTRHPSKMVALVESEKTALICAGLMPQFIWLATGGRNVNIERSKSVLKGRRTVVFPDMDAQAEWQEKYAQSENMTVSDAIVEYAGPDASNSTMDIADLIILQMRASSQKDPACSRYEQTF